MAQYQTYLVFGLFAKVAAATFRIPFSHESHCLINFVYGSGTSPEDSMIHTVSPRDLYTYTLHQVASLDFVIEADEIIETNFTIHERYFRLYGKFQESCLVFILLTPSFNETLQAIHKSGFSTSDEVMFFIRVKEVTRNDPMIFSFGNNLFASDVEPFHASLAFFANSSSSLSIGLHCYFCLENLVATDNRTLSGLRFLIQHLNSEGYGRRLQIRFPIYHARYFMEGCTEISEQLKTHRTLLAALKKCLSLQLLIASVIESRANVSFVQKDENEFGNWFLQFIWGEAAFLQFPNYVAFSRDVQWIANEVELNAMTCVSILSNFDFTFSGFFPTPVPTSVVMVVLAYIWMYQNFGRGIDTFWTLLGKPFMIYRHHRKLIAFSLLSSTLFWCSYNAYISTDCMRIAAFPPLEQLLKLKYRLWIHPKFPKKDFMKFLVRERKFMPVTLPLLNMIGGTMTWDELLYQNDKYAWSLKLGELIEKIVSEKLFIIGTDKDDLLYKLGSPDMLIKGKYICHLFHLIKDVPMPVTLPNSARISGYMSRRVASLLLKLSETGIYAFGHSLEYFVGQNELKDLQMAEANSLVAPVATSLLQSPIGISGFYQVAVGVSLLVLFVVAHQKQMNLGRLRKCLVPASNIKQRILIMYWKWSIYLR